MRLRRRYVLLGVTGQPAGGRQTYCSVGGVEIDRKPVQSLRILGDNVFGRILQEGDASPSGT